MSLQRRALLASAGLSAAAIGAFVAIQGGRPKTKADKPLDPAAQAFWSVTVGLE